MIREGDKWKVAAVSLGGIELSTIRFVAPVPAEIQLEELVMETLMRLNQAVKTADFTAFHEQSSMMWKKQITPQGMQKAFQVYIDNKVDFSSYKNAKPQFEPPASVDQQGVLTIKGRFAVQPNPLGFNLQYVRENASWKLLGIFLTYGNGNAPK